MRLFWNQLKSAAIAVQHASKCTRQICVTEADLYCNVEEDPYVRPPKWRQERVQEGHCYQLNWKNLPLNSKDLDVKGGDLVKSFLGLEVEQLEG